MCILVVQWEEYSITSGLLLANMYNVNLIMRKHQLTKIGHFAKWLNLSSKLSRSRSRGKTGELRPKKIKKHAYSWLDPVAIKNFIGTISKTQMGLES